MRMNVNLMNFVDDLLCRNYHFTVTSAFRTEKQNNECGGSPRSQHLVGEAIDLKPYGSTSFSDLLSFIRDNSPFDQLIIYSTFIHVSFGFCNRRQVIDHRK